MRGDAVTGPSVVPPGRGAGPLLAERLDLGRRRHFVGREPELELFRRALLAERPPFAVLHLYGPGGVGKTALLGEYARLAAGAGVAAYRLDGRDVEPAPPAFLPALAAAMGLDGVASPLAALAQRPRGVLLLDTAEALAPLDAWLREAFLPRLPQRTLVVIAGRAALPPAWRTAPGWEGLVRRVPLRNLRPEESRAYLRARGLPAARHDEALAFTHGHPLALALVADVQSQEGAAVPFRPQDRPDVVRALLERFVQQAPGPRHREALEVCAHARVTTEGLLAEALGAGGAGELFAWLRGLSFVEEGPEGVFPHDLAREVLEADLRWRNPEAFSDLHRRVRGAVVRRLQETGGRAQQRAGVDLMHLHRANPLMRRLRVFDRETLGAGYALPATEPDRSPILDCVRRHEGDESARVAAYWWGRQPGAFLAFRDGGGQLIGFHATVSLRDATPEDVAADPAVRPALDYARRYGPPRAGEELLLHRFWMGCSTYQALGPALNLNAITCSRLWITTPRLSWSFAVIADPELWQETFTYLRLRRAPEAEFAAGGRPYGVFAHDWRAEPPAAWLEEMGQREIATDLTLDDLRPPPPPLVVLSQPEFAAAVRQALRDYTHPAVLAASPLLRSRLTADPGPGAPPAALLRLLRQAVEALRGTPRDEKLYRALQRTYLQPAATQELAAEALGLPFSTYRYHLARGIDRVTQSLWRRELEGPEG